MLFEGQIWVQLGPPFLAFVCEFACTPLFSYLILLFPTLPFPDPTLPHPAAMVLPFPYLFHTLFLPYPCYEVIKRILRLVVLLQARGYFLMTGPKHSAYLKCPQIEFMSLKLRREFWYIAPYWDVFGNISPLALYPSLLFLSS